MIQKKHILPGFQPVLPDIPFKAEQLLFFDIETTGFSPANSSLYLAGAVYCRNGIWNTIQWFAEAPSQEKTVLQTFFDFCREFRCLIHFNGEGFDLPYLEGRAQRCGLDTPFSQIESLDIYRRIRPYRRHLKLTHMNQKALEAFLDISREDRCSGGELISVYHRYTSAPDNKLLKLLLLHNLDDLKGMLSLTQLLAYPALFSGQNFTLRDADWEEAADGQPNLILELTLQYQIPRPLSCKIEFGYLTAENSTCRLLIHAFEGELKYFIPDYRNYFYFPDSDNAIHKNLAVYTDPSRRVPAKADTCYQRRYGLFLPQKTPLFTPVFQTSRKDRTLWFECTEQFMNTEDALFQYIKSLISI